MKKNLKINKKKILQRVDSFNKGFYNIQYIQKQILNQTKFYITLLVQSQKNNQNYSLTIYSKNVIQCKRYYTFLNNQISIRKSLNHPSIIKFDHSFQDISKICILQQYASNKNLAYLLQKRKILTTIQVRFFIAQIIKGYRYLHQNGIIKKYLKPEDVLLDKQLYPKLSNFHFSQKVPFITKEKPKELQNIYLAPQILQQKDHNNKVDCWSIGNLIHQLLTGKNIYQKIYVQNKKVKFLYNIDNNLSKQAKNIIFMLTHKDVSKRMTVDQIYIHPFMKNEYQIPKVFLFQQILPKVILQCKPSNNYVNSYLKSNMNSKYYYKNLQQSQPTQHYLSQEFKRDQMKTMSMKKEITFSKVLIKQFHDLTFSYGFGYKLSNSKLTLIESIGFNFNDKTIIIIDSSIKNIFYFDQQPIQYTYESLPNDQQLKKKFIFLQTFIANVGFKIQHHHKQEVHSKFIYIKKYVKTRNAINFYLSSNAIQVIFNDKTQIYIEKQLIIYIDKMQVQHQINFSDINQDIRNKISYTLTIGKFLFKMEFQIQNQFSNNY